MIPAPSASLKSCVLGDALSSRCFSVSGWKGQELGGIWQRHSALSSRIGSGQGGELGVWQTPFCFQGTLYVTIPFWGAAGSHWVRRRQQGPVGRAWLGVSKSGCCSVPL